MNNLKSRILDVVRARGRVIFPQLEPFDGFLGDSALSCPGYPSIIYWLGVSSEAVRVLNELLAEGKIALRPAHPFTYLVGAPRLPALPLAKSLRHYRKERWFPVCLCAAPVENTVKLLKQKKKPGGRSSTKSGRPACPTLRATIRTAARRGFFPRHGRGHDPMSLAGAMEALRKAVPSVPSELSKGPEKQEREASRKDGPRLERQNGEVSDSSLSRNHRNLFQPLSESTLVELITQAARRFKLAPADLWAFLSLEDIEAIRTGNPEELICRSLGWPPPARIPGRCAVAIAPIPGPIATAMGTA